MTQEQIKKAIKAIADENDGIVYTDAGQGSSGPGFANSELIKKMLDQGEFDNARAVKFDENLARESFAGTSIEFDPDTNWVQIQIDGENNFSRTFWIW